MSRKRRRKQANVDVSAIRRLCDMTTDEVADEFDALDYAFIDNGASVLGVAHMDTVNDAWWQPRVLNRRAINKKSSYDRIRGTVNAIELDDRLGIYMLTDLLPRLGVKLDWLLTDDEESGRSTAQVFKPTKEYNWIVGFDRAGLDVVMYQYEDMSWASELKSLGMSLETGTYSDIADLGHLGVTGFNWGVGYHKQHTHKCYARVADVMKSARAFVEFYNRHKDEAMPFTPPPVKKQRWWDGWGRYDELKEDEDWADRLYEAYLEDEDVFYDEDEYPCCWCGEVFPASELGYFEFDCYCHDCADMMGIPTSELEMLPDFI